MERAVILEGARTPVGKFLGAFSDVPAVDLGIHAVTAALGRAGVQPGDVDEPAFTVNMACGSGTKAVQVAAEQVILGNAEVVVAGGQENMTRTPFLLDRMRFGYRMGDATLYDGMNKDGFLDPLCGLIMGETAENLARRYEIPREEQDEFALRSQQKAAASAGRRALEIEPVEVPGKGGPAIVDRDEHPRPETT